MRPVSRVFKSYIATIVSMSSTTIFVTMPLELVVLELTKSIHIVLLYSIWICSLVVIVIGLSNSNQDTFSKIR